MPKPHAARGIAAEGHVDRLLNGCVAIERGRFCWHQHHPPIRGGVRAKSGLPDREIVRNGRAYFLEVKEKTGESIEIGLLEGADTDCGGGIRPGQAATMDTLTAAGSPCYVVAILEVPAKAPRKRKDGTISDPGRRAATIARIVPWPTWRALMAHAEEQRREVERWQITAGSLMVAYGPDCALPEKPTVNASIPASALAAMGRPLASAADILKALEQP